MKVLSIFICNCCLLLSISITFFSCESEDFSHPIEKRNFDEAYLMTNPEVLKAFTPELFVPELSEEVLYETEFNADRFTFLIEKESLDKTELRDLKKYLHQLGFSNKASYVSFQAALYQAGKKLIEETNIEDLPFDQVKSVLENAVSFEDAIVRRRFFEKATPCRKQGYIDCERDVSSALAGDLFECVVGAAVTGLFTGGVPGIVVGAACTGNALVQGTIASRACVREHCP